MTHEECIKYDITELEKYFGIISSSILSEPKWSYLNASTRFNMVTDIFGCLEFWLKRLCDHHKSKCDLNLSYKDIRGKNDLSTYNKYLVKVATIDMTSVNKEYCQLQDLRKIRNIIVHCGAHTTNEDLGKIDGIQLSGTLVMISQVFVNDSLNNADNYLLHVANA